MIIYVQEWTESERGWGQRPDGFSIHRTLEDSKVFIDEYWKTQPRFTPDVYSFPSGAPFTLDIDEDVMEPIESVGNRYYLNPPWLTEALKARVR